jgi:hypothetical protein
MKPGMSPRIPDTVIVRYPAATQPTRPHHYQF